MFEKFKRSQIWYKKIYSSYILSHSKITLNFRTLEKKCHILKEHFWNINNIRMKIWYWDHGRIESIKLKQNGCLNFQFFIRNYILCSGKYVVSIRHCNEPQNTTNFDFIAWETSMKSNLMFWRCQLVNQIMTWCLFGTESKTMSTWIIS